MYPQIIFDVGSYLMPVMGKKWRQSALLGLEGFCRPRYHCVCSPTMTNSPLELEPDYKSFQVSTRRSDFEEVFSIKANLL